MSQLLKTLTYAKRPAITEDRALMRKRDRLVRRLELQRELVQAKIEGRAYIGSRKKKVKDPQTGESQIVTVQRRYQPWFYRCGEYYYFEVKASNKAIELKPGYAAIQVDDLPSLLKLTDTLIKSVEMGELDNHLNIKRTANPKS